MPDEGPVWSMRNLKLLNERVVRAKKGISIDIPFILQNQEP